MKDHTYVVTQHFNYIKVGKEKKNVLLEIVDFSINGLWERYKVVSEL